MYLYIGRWERLKLKCFNYLCHLTDWSLLYLGERTDIRSLWKLVEAGGEGEEEGEARLVSELLGLGWAEPTLPLVFRFFSSL